MQEIIKYQEIDSNLRKLENELGSSKNRKSAAEMQQYLKEGQNKLLKLEEVADSLMKQYQKATNLYNDFVQKLEQLTKAVDSDNGEKSAELEAMINNFTSTADNLENNISVLANKIAAANKEFELLMSNAKKAKHNLEIYKANYSKEKERLDPQINKLKVELEKQKTKVDSALLAKYLAKAESRLFPIFVSEANGKCGGCRMEISAGKLSVLKSKGIIECENCGRLIYIQK